MKDILLPKLIIVIESTNCKNISNEVMNSIYALEQLITSNKELKLSFARNENEIKKEIMNNPEYVSPENWNYWPV